jgi:hypothetical protein
MGSLDEYARWQAAFIIKLAAIGMSLAAPK